MEFVIEESEKNRRPIFSWCKDVEDGAMAQAINLSNHPKIHHPVALMPDCHQGYGMPIGGVIAVKNAIIPYAVGSDIGCGMLAARTELQADKIRENELRDILNLMKQGVPVGFSYHSNSNKEYKENRVWIEEWLEKNVDFKKEQMEKIPFSRLKAIFGLKTKEELVNYLTKSLGTLGGGNHFSELQTGDDGYVWLMLHSGSRNMGNRIASYHHEIALQLNNDFASNIPDKDLSFLPINRQEGIDYLKDMQFALEYAYENRQRMMRIFAKAFKRITKKKIASTINIHHNYASLEHHYGKNLWIHRKGATSARKGEAGIIPGSMGTSSFIVEGLGYWKSYMSCFPKNTRILTDKGIIPIEEIYNDHKKYSLISYDHKNRKFENAKIIDKSKIKSKTTIYDIFQRGVRKGNTIRCTESHPFATFKDSNFVYEAIGKIEKKKNPVIVPLIINNNSETKIVENDFYYLLGTILSDGTIYINDKEKNGKYKNKQYYRKHKYIRFFQVNTKEKQEYINYVKKIFDKTFDKVYFYHQAKRKGIYIKEKRIINSKKSISITGKGNEIVARINKYIKRKLYMDIFKNKDIALNFLAGYLDGDGSVNRTKITISIGKTINIKYLIAAFLSLGIVYKVYPNRENYIIEFFDKDILQKLKKICKRLKFDKIKRKGIYTEKNILK